MSISPYFEDASIVNQLRSFFDLDEQWNIDFDSALSQIEELDEDYFQVKVKGRLFTIHNVLGIVEEVDAAEDEDGDDDIE